MFILSTSIIKPYTGVHMNRTKLWMTGLLALTLGACSSDSTRSSSSDTAGSTSNTASAMSGSGDAAASTDAMDDGGSQGVLVDAMPGYKTGDRVRYSKGLLQQF